ncbi:hypothetical protein JHK82_033899 [Glycine max]|nr:hypothetical protein JHK85_034611 [Glycine max]KAG4986291.1 hypothetical protein JHK86_033982 [Glycine max]KAG5119479.1 hypothetical protein JHK82_033899 [Glycine max]
MYSKISYLRVIKSNKWQFGYNSCFIRNNLLMYLRLILGFAEQFLCSYSTFPLYTLVTQSPVRDTIDYWGRATKRTRRHGEFTDHFELQPLRAVSPANRFSSRHVTLLRLSASVSSAPALRFRAEKMPRSSSIPKER